MTGLPIKYIPGTVYSVTVADTQSALPMSSFALTAERLSDNAKAGTFGGVDNVTDQLNGAGVSHLNANTTVKSWTFTWQAPSTAQGDITFYVVGLSANNDGQKSGDQLNLKSIRVPASDTTAPAVSITAPAPGATISGSAVTVSASATDNVGVVGVQFKVDGVNVGAEDTVPPYSAVLNTTGLSNGTHSLTAVARDAAGNSTTSTAVAATVNNVVAGVLTSITLTPASATIAAGGTQQFAAVAKDQFGATMSGVALTWASSNASAATVSASGLATGKNTGATVLTANITVSASGVTSNAGVLTVNAPTNVYDVNGDGIVTVQDVQVAVNQVLAISACTKGDVNLDGACNVSDIQMVVNAVLGL